MLFFFNINPTKQEENTMPELPEVETTRKGIEPKISQQTITKVIIRNAKFRWPVDLTLTQKLPGLRIRKISRRAKYLLLATEKGHLIIHLGMSGNLRVLPVGTPTQKHDHIDVIFENGYLLRLHDPRRFGAFLWTEKPPEEHDLIQHLGPEPLTEAFSANDLYQKAKKRQVSLKSLVMDNKVVVGVGNIYANESLFLSGLHPEKPANKLTKKQAESLTQNIKTVLAKAIETGGTTLKDFLTPDGKPGYFEQQLAVYGRADKNCPVCGTKIEKIIQNQRASYFCPNCQPK